MRGAVAAARTSGADSDTASDVGTALLAAGTALADAAGGASGALYGVLLTETGGRLQALGEVTVDLPALADAVEAAQDAVTELGGARPGDKTMVDALAAFTGELRAAVGRGEGVADGFGAAAAQARQAAADTADLDAVVGRAARLGGERGRGSPDPGATSLAHMLVAAGAVVAERCTGQGGSS
jgi:dihydroxyacetone kinase